MAEKYRGFKNKHRYNKARGTRLSQWRRKKLARLSEAQNHRCAYCQQDTFLGEVLPKSMNWNQRATLEHFVPQSENVQTNKDENLIMACDECNATRGSSDAFIFYRTIHDKEFRNNRNNELMKLTKREIRRNKSFRRKTRKIEIRNEAEGEKLQRLIEKEERARALAYTLVTYYPSELIISN